MCIRTQAGLFFASRSKPIMEAYAAAPQIRATIWNSVMGSVPLCAMVRRQLARAICERLIENKRKETMAYTNHNRLAMHS